MSIKVPNFAYKLVHKVNKKADSIYIGAGIGAGLIAIVSAIVQTIKVPDLVDEHYNNLIDIHERHSDKVMDLSDRIEDKSKVLINYTDDCSVDIGPETYRELEEIPEFNDEMSCYRKSLFKEYIRYAGKLTLHYLPTIGLASGSVICTLKGVGRLKKQNAGLISAYGVLDQCFKRYRRHVIEELGPEADRRFRFGITQDELEVGTVDKNGKVKVKKEAVCDIDEDTGKKYSDYARYFDSTCAEWTKNPEYNLCFVKAQEKIANNMLKARRHLFLNEVYDMLGIPRTEMGQYVGWIFDEKNPTGDNYVDFGIYDLTSEATRRFVNGLENVILLDFNVDGVIVDKI